MEIDMEKLQRELLAIKRMNQEWENRKKSLDQYHSKKHQNENNEKDSSVQDFKKDAAE
jgi:hypothetical protein